MVVELGLKDLEIYGDSQLLISQLSKEYEVKKEHLVPYQKHAPKLLKKFNMVKINYVLRSINKMVYTRVGLASTLALGAEETMYVLFCNRWVVTPTKTKLDM